MSALVANNASGSLLVGIDDLDTTVLLRPGQGARFPSPILGQDWFYLTIQNAQGELELVKCTARDSDTLTVKRGVGGTVALSFKSDSIVELRPCAELFNDKVDTDKYEERMRQLDERMRQFEAALNLRMDNFEGTSNQKIADQASFNAKTYFPYSGGTVTGAITATGDVKANNVTATGKVSSATAESKEYKVIP